MQSVILWDQMMQLWRYKQIECGMCDSVFNDFETLNTLLSTCEIYKCNECNFITTKLPEIKAHLDDHHNGGTLIQINHSKQSKANREEYDFYFYTKRSES